jgi:hypothetical protein
MYILSKVEETYKMKHQTLSNSVSKKCSYYKNMSLYMYGTVQYCLKKA